MATLLLGGLAACTEDGTIQPSEEESPIDDGVKVAQPVGEGSAVTKPDGTVGRVTSMMEAGLYTQIVVTYPPAWSCPAYAEKISGPTSAGSSLPPGTTQRPADEARLAPTTCQDLAARRRPALLADAESQLVAARNQLVAQNCTAQTEVRCLTKQGETVDPSRCRGGWADAGARGGPAIPANSPTSPGGSATQHSSTNNQVAGVDEADFVKNDGKTMYVLSNGGLNVIEAWPASSTRTVARVALPGAPRRLFLDQNRLVVFTRMQASSGSRPGAGASNPSDQGCTYGYDCRFTSEGGHTMIIVFDVTTPATPRELGRYELSGAYVASRRVGPVVYTVVHDSGAGQLPGIDTHLHASSYADLMAQFERRRRENAEKIASTPDAFFLPWIQQTRDGKVVTDAVACNDALATAGAAGASFVSLMAFDVTTLDGASRTVIGSNPGYVYASPTALYMAVDRTAEPGLHRPYDYGRAVDSVVHKFRLDGTRTRYAGSALLPGHILNQFAMDEQDGVLRVASTRGWVPEPNVASYISTFIEKDGGLAPLGQLGGIAPTEDIRSVRFDGDRGYVVTFKKTDPLFVFDLSKPAEPKMLGELKIPGYSTYMHRLDADHLLAVGFDADDKQDFAFFNGIQIQIFDVSDPASPKLKWKKSIGTRGSASEALLNHLAFNYFAPKKVLALPMTICEGGGDGQYGQKLTFSGLMVFDVSLTAGITERGRLPFTNAEDVMNQTNCQAWWTNGSTLVKRSVFMDDWVYGITDRGLRVAPMSQLTQPVQTVAF